MKRVLVVGILGVYNYGCEAIVRGTVNILKSQYPSIIIDYASYNYKDDVKRLKGCDITIVERPPMRRWNIHNIIRKICSYFHYRYELPFDSIGWVKEYDTLFSIGGDMYTLAPDDTFYKALAVFCEKCKKRGMRYVLWGASVGKFEKNRKALRFYRNHLLKIDSLVIREKHTLDYLCKIGACQNVSLAPDPAFFVAPSIFKVDRKFNNVIGINLSPLSALYQYENIKVAIKHQADSIMRLMDKRLCKILFLPHVLSAEYTDNDLLYMLDIYNALNEKYQKRVSIVDNDPGFIGLKYEIMKCDIVIAARMHCAVNAISAGVPALFLSYSDKAKGMAEYVYSSANPVISLTDFEDTSKLSNLLDECNFSFDIKTLRQYDFSEIFK